MKLSNQQQRVIRYSRDFGGVTAWEAAKELGVMRLSVVIYDLKEKGYNVRDWWIDDYNRYGEKVRYKRYEIGGCVESMVL